MGPRKVVHVVTGLDVGGIETYLLRVLRYTDRDRLAMDVCYEARDPGAYAADVQALGCRLFRVAGKRGFVGYLRRLEAILERERYDAICDFTGDFAAASMLAGRLAGVRNRVAFYRGHIERRLDPARALYLRACRRLVRQYATTVLTNAVTNLDASYLRRGTAPMEHHVVPNGIDTDEFSPADAETKRRVRAELGIDGELVIGHVGGLREVKNHLLMVRVFDALRETVSGARLLFVGDGPQRTAVESEVARRGLAAYVQLAGLQTAVPDYLRCMDLFWFPSRFEGMPNAMMEAQATGLPVVASDVPSVRQHVPDTATGCLVEPRDERRWLEVLQRLAGDEALRREQGRANREHAERSYALGPAIERFLAFLEK